MSLRKKTIIGAGALSMLIVVAMYGTIRLILEDSYERIEQEEIFHDLETAKSALDKELAELKLSVYDYAVWDETYNYVDGVNKSYIEDNIANPAFAKLKINIVAILNADHQLLYFRSVDFGNDKATILPQKFLELVCPLSECPLFRAGEEQEGESGIIIFPEGPMLVASQPVLKNNGIGPANGILIFGNYLDEEKVKKFAKSTNLQLNINRIILPSSPDDRIAFAALGKETPLLIRQLNNEISKGYKLVTDIYSKPALVIAVNHDRSAHQQGLKTVRFLLILSSLACLAIFFAIYYYLKRYILGRIYLLSQYVQNFSKSGELPGQIKKQPADEIGQLADSFLNMTVELADSSSQLAEYKKNLDEKVRKKTEELSGTVQKIQKDKNKIEKQRRAIMNVLEDVSDSEAEMKRINEQLEKRSHELESLKNLSDDLTVLYDVDEAVKVLNGYLIGAVSVNAVAYLVLNPIDEKSFFYKTFLKNEASESFVKDLKTKFIKNLVEQNNEKLKTVAKILDSINPQIFGARLNNSSTVKAADEIFFPLEIGESKLGAILVSCSSENSGYQEDRKLIAAMITSFTFFISHLYSLFSTQHSQTISLVESLSDGVIMFNNDKNIVLANPAFVRYTGLTVRDFALEDFYESFGNENISGMVDWALSKGQTSHMGELKINNRFYEIFVTSVKENQDKIVGGAIIMHDITHIKEISQMKTEFVSVASHQLRTPLTAIKLFTEMLLKGDVGKLKKEQKDYLSDINQSTDRMARLVNDLLNVTRIESGRLKVDPQPTDLINFVRKIIDETKPIADAKNVKIDFMCGRSGLQEIPLDQNLIRQVVHNLVVNAIRYSPADHGKVIVEIKKQDKNYFLFSVTDNGIGIPEKVKSRIFEKFFRADNAVKIATEGTGLGLFVCRMIVESSGGKIWFESTEGKGAAFYFTIPIKGMERKEGERGLVIS